MASKELIKVLGTETEKVLAGTARDFVKKLLIPSLTEYGLLFQDTVRYLRVKNQVNIVLKAKKFFDDKGLDSKKIPTYWIIPSTFISKYLREAHRKYISEPNKRTGKKKKDLPIRIVFVKDIVKYKNNIEELVGSLN